METAARDRGQDWSDEKLIDLLDDEDGEVRKLLDKADEAAVARKCSLQTTGVENLVRPQNV